MAKETALDWLHEIAKQREPDKFDWEQAKQMEKEQIMDAYCQGVEEDVYNNPLKTGEEYYNEKYKQ